MEVEAEAYVSCLLYSAASACVASRRYYHHLFPFFLVLESAGVSNNFSRGRRCCAVPGIQFCRARRCNRHQSCVREPSTAHAPERDDPNASTWSTSHLPRLRPTTVFSALSRPVQPPLSGCHSFQIRPPPLFTPLLDLSRACKCLLRLLSTCDPVS